MKPEDIHRLFQKYFTEQDLEGLGTLYAENAIFIPGSERNPIIGKISRMNKTLLSISSDYLFYF